MTTLYRCVITLLEPTFFSSREISAYYQTEPLLGNYALAYALGFCTSPYYNNGTIHYQAHLSELNETGVYVTPGTPTVPPIFSLQSFNSQPDSYSSAMGQGFLAAPPEGGYIEKRGASWYAFSLGVGRGKKLPAANRPQYGRIRALAIGMRFRSYVISREPLAVPSYIRLGKWMSKARVECEPVRLQRDDLVEQRIDTLLNPADLPPDVTLHFYDLINVPPTPLIHHAELSGAGYRLDDGHWLPADMRFGVEGW